MCTACSVQSKHSEVCMHLTAFMSNSEKYGINGSNLLLLSCRDRKGRRRIRTRKKSCKSEKSVAIHQDIVFIVHIYKKLYGLHFICLPFAVKSASNGNCFKSSKNVYGVYTCVCKCLVFVSFIFLKYFCDIVQRKSS